MAQALGQNHTPGSAAGASELEGRLGLSVLGHQAPSLISEPLVQQTQSLGWGVGVDGTLSPAVLTRGDLSLLVP